MVGPKRNSLTMGATCPYCEVYQKDFKAHLENLDQNQEFLCNFCDLAKPNFQCVENHKLVVHDDSVEVITCDICYVDFSDEKFLNFHKNLSHKEENSEENDKNEVPIDPNDFLEVNFTEKIQSPRTVPPNLNRPFTPQCGTFGIFLPFRFYVKSSLKIVRGSEFCF